MLVVVESRRPFCWSCEASEHMSKVFPGKNVTIQLQPTTTTTLLGPLFKMTTVDGKLVEDPRNFSKTPGVNTCLKDTVFGFGVILKTLINYSNITSASSSPSDFF